MFAGELGTKLGIPAARTAEGHCRGMSTPSRFLLCNKEKKKLAKSWHYDFCMNYDFMRFKSHTPLLYEEKIRTMRIKTVVPIVPSLESRKKLLYSLNVLR